MAQRPPTPRALSKTTTSRPARCRAPAAARPPTPAPMTAIKPTPCCLVRRRPTSPGGRWVLGVGSRDRTTPQLRHNSNLSNREPKVESPPSEARSLMAPVRATAAPVLHPQDGAAHAPVVETHCAPFAAGRLRQAYLWVWGAPSLILFDGPRQCAGVGAWSGVQQLGLRRYPPWRLPPRWRGLLLERGAVACLRPPLPPAGGPVIAPLTPGTIVEQKASPSVSAVRRTGETRWLERDAFEPPLPTRSSTVRTTSPSPE